MRKLIALSPPALSAPWPWRHYPLAATESTSGRRLFRRPGEIPKQVVKDTTAHGLFRGTLSGTTLNWKKLTGPATAAHIHMAAKGKAGDVVVPLCGPCNSGATGTATVTASEITAFKKHLSSERAQRKEPERRDARTGGTALPIELRTRPGRGRIEALRQLSLMPARCLDRSRPRYTLVYEALLIGVVAAGSHKSWPRERPTLSSVGRAVVGLDVAVGEGTSRAEEDRRWP
jgi:hypothetical protein